MSIISEYKIIKQYTGVWPCAKLLFYIKKSIIPDSSGTFLHESFGKRNPQFWVILHLR